MLVFIDESGDPGFKLLHGSSPIFVTSMVVFRTDVEARETQDRILRLRKDLKVTPEFKFNKCKSAYKDAFFGGISDCRFRSRFVVVKKETIRSSALKTAKESFYKFFIRMMMQHDGGVLQDAKIIIDGSGDRTFKRQFKSYLKRHMGKDRVRDVQLKDSQRDPLIQLADMAAGAVARSYRTDRPDCSRWREMLVRNDQIDDIWEFE